MPFYYSHNENPFDKPYNLSPMKKYHYIIISITFAIYGFVFYQMNFGGPDVYEYFRNIHINAHTQTIETNIDSKQETKVFDDFNSTYAGYQGQDSISSLSKNRIYFNEDKSPLKLDCENVSSFGEIIGQLTIGSNNGNEYFYYKSLKSIFAYDKNIDNQGMKVKCFQS